jgi:hypothetical protein
MSCKYDSALASVLERNAPGGARPSDPKLAKGLFIEATIFADVTMAIRIGPEECIEELLRFSRDVNLRRRSSGH